MPLYLFFMKTPSYLLPCVALSSLMTLSGSASLVYYWNFDNNNLNYTGTGTGAVTSQAAGTFVASQAGGGQALSLNGLDSTSGSHFDIAAVSGLNYSAITVSFWALTPTATSGANFDDWFSVGDATNSIAGEISNPNPAIFPIGTVTGSTSLSPTTTVAGDGQWHLITWVASQANNTNTLYVDGNVAATSTWSASGTIASLRIGGRIGTDVRNIQATIDEVRVYDQALTQAEVQALPVPEPSSLGLVLIGAGPLLLRRRRKC